MTGMYYKALSKLGKFDRRGIRFGQNLLPYLKPFYNRHKKR